MWPKQWPPGDTCPLITIVKNRKQFNLRSKFEIKYFSPKINFGYTIEGDTISLPGGLWWSPFFSGALIPIWCLFERNNASILSVNPLAILAYLRHFAYKDMGTSIGSLNPRHNRSKTARIPRVDSSCLVPVCRRSMCPLWRHVCRCRLQPWRVSSFPAEQINHVFRLWVINNITHYSVGYNDLSVPKNPNHVRCYRACVRGVILHSNSAEYNFSMISAAYHR